MSTYWYQSCRCPIAPKWSMPARYARTARRATCRCVDLSKSWNLAATTKLVASRSRSHSQGPGSVSSKSFWSNTSWRSGEA
jgi:hypothetical protein